MIEKTQDSNLRDARFQLLLDTPLAVAKKPKLPKDKERAKKFVLKTVDKKDVNVLYNDKIDSLKIKCAPYKVVYSYNDFPSEIQTYYQNTYQLYNSLKAQNNKIQLNTATKTLIFHDKRKPKPVQPASIVKLVQPVNIVKLVQPVNIVQQPPLIDDYNSPDYLQSLASDVIQDLESSTQILSLVKGPHRSLLADHYATLGKEYLKCKSYNSAKEYLTKAIDVYGQLHLHKSEQCAKAHHQLGNLYILQGEKDDKYEFDEILPLSHYQQRAIEKFIAARDILQAIKNSNLIQIKATILNSLGLAYSRFDYQQAKGYFLKALSHAQKLGMQSKPYFDAYLNLANIHNRMKQYDQAYQDLSNYLNMINSGPQFQMKSFKIQCLLQKACLGLKRYKQGLEIIYNLTIFSQLEDRSLRLEVENIQARWSHKLLNIETSEAIEHLETFLRILQEYYPKLKYPRIFAIANKLAQLRGQ